MMRTVTFWAYDNGKKFCVGIAPCPAENIPEPGAEVKLEIGGVAVCQGRVIHVSQTEHSADVTLEAG